MTAKRLLSLVLALALLLCISPAFAAGIGDAAYTGPATPTTAPMTMYVVTDNGRGLNVRSSPYLGNNIIGLAVYGSKVDVLRFLDDGWACIVWKQYEAYVQSRYLQWYAPSPAVPTAAPTAAPVSPTVAPGYTDTLAVLNAEFRTARLVTPFTVTVTPTHTNGWVNMRWAPSTNTEVLAIYRSGEKLTVIAETQSWYQVTDPDTEATGYIMKTYVKRSY